MYIYLNRMSGARTSERERERGGREGERAREREREEREGDRPRYSERWCSGEDTCYGAHKLPAPVLTACLNHSSVYMSKPVS